ncbi:MAG: hypothetical protein D6793_06790, partial [Thermoflexia bacterium]
RPRLSASYFRSAARLKMRYAISYADAFAAVLAQELGAVLVSGDPELVALQGEISLERLERKCR